LRPATFFWAVVPPWLEIERLVDDEPDFLPPRLEAPGELAIRAARSFDMPFSFRFSYCAWLGSGSAMRSSPPSFPVATSPRRSSLGASPT
jgi:hypothetical protein